MDLQAPIAQATRERLVGRFGESIESWWAELPSVVTRLAQVWEVTIGEPVGRGSTSLVLRCVTRRGEAAMLKLTPDRDLAVQEAAALGVWGPSGRVPMVLAADADTGALLLEALPSELPLSVLGHESQPPIREVSSLIAALHRTASPADLDVFPPLIERITFLFDLWTHQFGPHGRQAGAVSAEQLKRGRSLAESIAVPESGVRAVLLHGDLHPGNVLPGGPGRELVAIDPRACVGDPAFDAVDWVLTGAATPANWQKRVPPFAIAVGCDPTRLWDWCRAFAAVLAATSEGRKSPAEIRALRSIAA